MNLYSGYLIVGSETRSVEIKAGHYLTSNSCIIEFKVKVERDPKDFSQIGSSFKTVAFYPADRLVITDIEELY